MTKPSIAVFVDRNLSPHCDWTPVAERLLACCPDNARRLAFGDWPSLKQATLQRWLTGQGFTLIRHTAAADRIDPESFALAALTQVLRAAISHVVVISERSSYQALQEQLRQVGALMVCLDPNNSGQPARDPSASSSSGHLQRLTLAPGVRRYQGVLSKTNWRPVAKSLLIEIHSIMLRLEPMVRSELIERLLDAVSQRSPQVTSLDIRKAITILSQSQLIATDTNHQGEHLLRYSRQADYLGQIDHTIINRIVIDCAAQDEAVDLDTLQQLLYQEYDRTLLASKINADHPVPPAVSADWQAVPAPRAC